MDELGVGTRIFNHGDMANVKHCGTITAIIRDARFGDSYEITPDDDPNRKPYRVHPSMISPRYLGNGLSRIVTLAVYDAWYDEHMAAFREKYGLQRKAVSP